MSFRIISLVFVAIVLTACQSGIQGKLNSSLKEKLTERIDSYLDAHHSNGQFNGSLLIMKGDLLLYSRSIGWANREFQMAHTDSTRFLIGSITKPFTAMAILLLEKEGKLSLNDPLSSYFPSFPRSHEVTVQQLLTHTSGIKDYHSLPDWREKGRQNRNPLKTVEDVSIDPYLFNPGAGFRYSNTGYILLGLIVEKVSGLSFESFIQQAILNPLHLKNTGIITNEKIVPHLANGYSSNPRETLKAEYIHYSQAFSSGNMYSTPQDLFLFCKAVMGSHLLDSQKTNAIFKISEVYGYGWGICNYAGSRAYSHHGGMNGYVGSMTFIPEGEYFICFLTNDDNTPKYRMAEDLASLVLGKDVENPHPTPLIPLTEEMKTLAIGSYLLKPGDTLHIYEQAGSLFMKETGQESHELFPYKEDGYSLSLLEFRVIFSDNQAKIAQSLILDGKTKTEALRLP